MKYFLFIFIVALVAAFNFQMMQDIRSLEHKCVSLKKENTSLKNSHNSLRVAYAKSVKNQIDWNNWLRSKIISYDDKISNNKEQLVSLEEQHKSLAAQHKAFALILTSFKKNLYNFEIKIESIKDSMAMFKLQWASQFQFNSRVKDKILDLLKRKPQTDCNNVKVKVNLNILPEINQ